VMKRRIDLRWLGRKHFIFLGIIVAATFAGVYTTTTSAFCYGGTLMGRGCYRGYFSDTFDQWGDNVLPEIKDGQALPTSDVYNTSTLFGYLRAAYYSGNAQRHTGAAFIFNTMEGLNGPGIGKGISPAQWDGLQARIQGLEDAGKISWFGNVSADTNSYWQGNGPGSNPDDDAYYGEFKNESGILIRDYDNNVIYRLLRRCANPIGQAFKAPDLQNYTLTPRVNSIYPDDVVEAGAKMSVTTRVDNVGNAPSQNTQWEVTQINVNPGKKAPHEDEGPTISGQAPCQSGGGAPAGSYFASADATCRNVGKGTGVFPLGTPSSLQPYVDNIDIGDVPVGTRVCFTFSVQPRSNTDVSWGHAKPICTVVGKKPKVQVWGGDLGVRGKIDTSTSVKSIAGTQRTFGSWVEYGAFSVGVNSRFASGSGTNNQEQNDQAFWSNLTFANRDDTGTNSYGQYTTAAGFRPLPNVAAFFSTLANKQPVGSATTSLNGLVYTNGDPIIVRTAGDLEITDSDIPAGHSVVILSTGTVTINGYIKYANGPFTTVKEIPQVIIIAQNINIKGTVPQVDSWLVAENAINTCYEFTGNLTAGKCNVRLEVNGPVITNHLVLNRTAGSDTGDASGDPAERFNLRPDAFLWANLQARGGNKAQTVYSTELPPRF
jgi:hypothetical protein